MMDHCVDGKQIVPEVLSGRKRMALAITEPYTGSDVANIRTTAKRTPDGKYFIVNGVKKWITTGTLPRAGWKRI